MTPTRSARTELPFLPATAAGRGVGSFPLGSEQSRAAARFLMSARIESEVEGDWDKEFDVTGLAELLCAARERVEQRERQGEAMEQDWSPFCIPPGKENTSQGRLAVRINAANARMARYKAERQAEH